LEQLSSEADLTEVLTYDRRDFGTSRRYVEVFQTTAQDLIIARRRADESPVARSRCVATSISVCFLFRICLDCMMNSRY
jgi:hypothetical protein